MKLEHANITVQSIEEAKKFLGLAFPGFQVRGQGLLADGQGSWTHFGNDDTYIALQQNGNHSPHSGTTYTNDGINHMGFVVDDMAELVERMGSGGYEPTDASSLDDHPYRRRAYFMDNNGFEWEFVEYLSAIPAEKNMYE
jgi:catechol 2,3-dioxygenase-like lactoylglutathione lyase family enzyme